MSSSLAFEGRAVAGAAVWMAVWWMTEAVPIPVTSLLPIVLFPLFGMGTMAEVASPYANSVVFLVMGGVILGLATEKAYLLENHDYDMQFGRWMLVGVPWAIVMLLIAWVVLTKLVFRAEVDRIPGGAEMIRGELAELGPMTTPERRIALIFATAIFFWVAVPFIADIPAVADVAPWLGTIDDTQVAIAAAIACFIVPARRRGEDASQTALLQWSAAKEIPWGLLLLFGVVVGLALTELTSNTATAAAFFPIFGAVALGLGMDPIFMTIAVTLAVCSAYMLPVATPSNAVAFGSGEVSIKQMVRAGVGLNVVSIGLIMLVMYTLVPAVFG